MLVLCRRDRSLFPGRGGGESAKLENHGSENLCAHSQDRVRLFVLFDLMIKIIVKNAYYKGLFHKLTNHVDERQK